MAIDAELKVAIDGGFVYFESPQLNEWARIVEMDSKPVEEQAELLTSRLLRVEGLVKRDGSVVTVETLKNKDYPTSFFFQLKAKWIQSVIDSAKGEASEKNG